MATECRDPPLEGEQRERERERERRERKREREREGEREREREIDFKISKRFGYSCSNLQSLTGRDKSVSFVLRISITTTQRRQ